MERLWKLSLVALLLGNAIDCWSTYRYVQLFGIEVEANLLPKLFIGFLGPALGLILFKIFLCNISLFGFWLFLRFSISRINSPWVGIRLSTFFGFSFGIFLVLAGMGITATVVGMPIVKLALLLFPEEVISNWAMFSRLLSPFILLLAFFLYIIFSHSVWRVLIVLDRRRRQVLEH